VSESATAELERDESTPLSAPDSSVHLLDFSQPTKFTTELRRRISRQLVPFCKATSTRLVGELRAPVELQQVDAHQLSWAGARGTLAEDAILVAIDVKPVGKQMLLALDHQLVLRGLDSMLGGGAEAAPASRRLTDIDWALTRRLADAIVLQLSIVWRDLGGLELSVDEVDLEGDAGIVVPISEPTFAIDFEVTIAGLPSKLSLLIPWAAVEPVAGELLGSGAQAATEDPRQTAALERGISAAKLLVRAEIGSTKMPVEQVLAIERGSLVNLRTKADQGVRLLADSVALARGVPGCSGVHRAVKLTTPIRPQTDPTARQLGASGARRSQSPGQMRAMLQRLADLRDIDLRVWAELGRARVSLSEALRLPEGAVLELDEGAGDPIELFVNGLAFGSGSLLVTDDGEWAVQVSALS
jgi:flagellar motor switch protein FliM